MQHASQQQTRPNEIGLATGGLLLQQRQLFDDQELRMGRFVQRAVQIHESLTRYQKFRIE